MANVQATEPQRPKTQAEQQRSFILYLWLALSILINLSGVANIVGGLVHWANFFRDFVDKREPMSWALFLVWPAFFLALNIHTVEKNGMTLFGAFHKEEGVIQSVLICISVFLIGPVFVLLVFPFISSDLRREAIKISSYVVAIVSAVIVLAFLNW